MMNLRRLIPILGCAPCAAAFAAGATTPARAARIVVPGSNAYPQIPNPRRNFRTPSFGADCASSFSRQCENDYIYYLDRARHRMGLGSYRLPADFTQLPPTHQLFILMNLDRTAYGVKPVTGMIAAFDSSAVKSMYRDQDPKPPASVRTSGSAEVWAGNYANPPAAYFAWVYDDGPGSPNLDCRRQTPSGCWGHRRAMFFQPRYSGAGIAVGRDERAGRAYAMDVAGLPRPVSRYVYTWKDARRDGAGTHVFKVKKP
jgi:hypothetical protein